MASRKQKQKAQEELLGIVMLGIAGGIYYLTKSLAIAITVVILEFVLFAAILIVIKNKTEAKIRRSGIREIDQMNGVQFENYLFLLFEQLGFRVKKTPTTNDYGADLILERNNERIVVQAKRYKSNVGIKAVQEIVSAKSYYKAEKAWVVTNSHFTQQALKLATSTNVKLIDRNELIEMLKDCLRSTKNCKSV